MVQKDAILFFSFCYNFKSWSLISIKLARCFVDDLATSFESTVADVCKHAICYYAPPLIGGIIKRCFCLTSVCLTSVCRVYLAGPKLRTERHRKTKIGTGVTHVTRDSDTTFKVKRSKVKVINPLYSPRPAAVSAGTYWAWETTATLRCARRR